MKIDRKNGLKQYLILLLFGMLAVLFNPTLIYAQQDSLAIENATNSSEEKVEVFSAVREELHRYMGYEELLPKYISLPYDVTMNTNIGGPFVDISYLFLMFLPVLLLFGLKNRMLKLLVGLLMLLFLTISLPTGFRSNQLLSNDEIATKLEEKMLDMSFSSTPLLNIKLKITQLANTFYQPLHDNIISVYSGEGDKITYPIFFFLLFIGFLMIGNKFKGNLKRNKAIGFFFLFYSFLWLILSSGVAWYGLLIFPLGLVLILIGFHRSILSEPVLKYCFLLFGLIWIVGALSYRFSNYSDVLSQAEIERGALQSELNTSVIHVGAFMYGTGDMDKARLTDFLFPAYKPIIDQINSDPTAKIYRIGTYFQYFIDRNHERVLEDNQLAYFDIIENLVKDKARIAQIIKDQGYRYLIVDFNVATIDRTPDGSLTKKARKFQTFIENNSKLEVIGTDRVVLNDNNQQTFGLRGRIVNNGSFIAFKIN